jgi:hypothetical protein
MPEKFAKMGQGTKTFFPMEVQRPGRVEEVDIPGMLPELRMDFPAARKWIFLPFCAGHAAGRQGYYRIVPACRRGIGREISSESLIGLPLQPG